MQSPLQIYNQVAKKFNVTVEKQVHPRQKLAYATEQSNQQRAIINRLLCDVATTQVELDKAKDDATKSAYQKKIAGYEDDLRQLSAGLDVSMEFEKELRDENPNTETTPADTPESS